MHLEVLTTGTELLLGTTRNTHGGWFGQQLFNLGLRISRQVTVPDGAPVGVAMRSALEQSDVLLVTGGLGPTSDDLTREELAEVLGIDLVIDEAAMRSLEAFFAKRGLTMAEANRKQALVPVGADVLPNPHGTAPGLYLPPRLSGDYRCAIFLLPGPPRELYPMYENEVVPRLRALAGVENIPELRNLRFVGIGESALQEELDEPLHAIFGLEVGYCARVGEVDLRLIGSGEAVMEGEALAAARFPKELVSREGESLEEAVVHLLRERRETLATAESCTGGLISNRITDVPGVSAVFTHGFVTYGNEAKRDVLGVSWDDLREHGAVSAPVAKQMAEGALRVSGSDYAVSVTGIAGPDGGSEEKPVGTVFLALARKGAESVVVKQFHPRPRLDFKYAVSQAALNLVRRVVGEAS